MNQKELKAFKEYLAYTPATGDFWWIKQPNKRIVHGSIAGNVSGRGYRQIQLHGIRVYAHRLAWGYMTGGYPRQEIDHINGDKDDNRWSNLRSVSRSYNQQNRKGAQANNISGLAGVSCTNGRFFARIQYGGKQKNLGCFSTAEEAHAAYINAKRKNHPGAVF